MTKALPHRTLVVASQNPHKVREIRALLTEVPVRVIALSDLPSPARLSEPHETFAANAAAKAATTARASGHLALADDSGLIVPALDGKPGVHSSRIADSDPERIEWLLEQMHGLTGAERTAYFVCVLALADCTGDLLGTWQDRADGVITREPQGTGGFGYDPLFWYPPAERTFAEMRPAEKNNVSHRGRALRAFRQDLPGILTRLPGDSPSH